MLKLIHIQINIFRCHDTSAHILVVDADKCVCSVCACCQRRRPRNRALHAFFVTKQMYTASDFRCRSIRLSDDTQFKLRNLFSLLPSIPLFLSVFFFAHDVCHFYLSNILPAQNRIGTSRFISTLFVFFSMFRPLSVSVIIRWEWHDRSPSSKIRFVPKINCFLEQRTEIICHAMHRQKSIFEIVAILGIQKNSIYENRIRVRFCWFAYWLPTSLTTSAHIH